MPRNGSGVYSKPPNTTAVPNTTIRSAMFNSVVDDLAQDANAPRPETAGGTGANNISDARKNLELDRKMVFSTKSADATLTKDDNNAAISVSATATMALAAASTLGMSWHALIIADGGTATIDPTGSEKINGAAALVLQDGQAALVIATGITGDEFNAIVFSSGQLPYAEKSANYTALASDNRSTLYFTAGATLSLTAAATLGSDWRMRVVAGGGQVIIDPNGSELVNGALTIVLEQGQEADLICTSTAFRAVITGNPLSGPQLQGFLSGFGLSANAADPANDVDIAAGAAASDTSPFYLMQLGFALTKRLDANWAVGTNQGGLDTGSVSAAATYYIWLIQRSDTLVVDALFSLSATAPTMPANYDRKRLIGNLIRVSSANGSPSPDVQSARVKRNPALTPSGSTFTIAGIPPAAQRVSIKLSGLIVSANAQHILRLGTSGGIVTSGYSGTIAAAATGGASGGGSTTFFPLLDGVGAPYPFFGVIELRRLCPGSNVWLIGGSTSRPLSSPGSNTLSGGVDIGAELTQLQISTSTGTPTFSGANSVSVEWEF